VESNSEESKESGSFDEKINPDESDVEVTIYLSNDEYTEIKPIENGTRLLKGWTDLIYDKLKIKCVCCPLVFKTNR
jgi:hypothetical protein